MVGKLNAALSGRWINISNWPGLQPLILQIFLRSWSAVLNIWMSRRTLLKHNLSNASASTRSLFVGSLSFKLACNGKILLEIHVECFWSRQKEEKIRSYLWASLQRNKYWCIVFGDNLLVIAQKLACFKKQILHFLNKRLAPWSWKQSEYLAVQIRTQEIYQISWLRTDHCVLISPEG